MFDSLEDILIEILSKLERQEQLLNVAIDSLTTKKAVAKFLNVSTKTIQNYIKDGRFEQNIHYFYDQNGRIVFIPSAVINFKSHKSHKDEKKKSKKVERQLHPSALKFLKKQGVVGSG